MVARWAKLGGLGLVLSLGIIDVAGSALAAQERALPAGETLYGIGCYSHEGQLVSVNTATAEVTAIGTGSTDDHASCAADSAYDPISGLAYWVAWNNSYRFPLFSIDPATGDSTFIGQILDTDANELEGFYGLFMGVDGVLYGMGYQDGQNIIFTVNTQTAVYTPIASLTNDGDPWQYDVWSTSYNPADGQYYFIDEYGALFQIDMTTGAITYQGTSYEVNTDWYGLAIDSQGQMWSSGFYNNNDGSNVASSTIDTWADSGSLQKTTDETELDGSQFFTNSNFIVYSASTSPDASESDSSLASTGFSAGDYAAIVCALLMVGGVLMVLRKRIV